MRRLPRDLPVLGLAVLCACGPAVLGPPPDPSPALPGSALSWNVWSVRVPPGLQAEVSSAGGTEHQVIRNAGDGCHLTLWPPVPASGLLDDQAYQLLQAYFGPVAGVHLDSPLDENGYRRGFSAQGFPTVELTGEPLDTQGRRTGTHARILAFGLGSQVAFFLGWERDTSQACLTEISVDPMAFTVVAYSLAFPGLTATNPHALRDALVGGWFGSELHATYNLAWGDVFAANGRHSDALGVETYQQLDATTVRDTLSTWHGNGAWAADGNRLTVWPDDGSKPARTRYFRISAQRNTLEPSGWRTYLYRLDSCAGVLCESWSVLTPR